MVLFFPIASIREEKQMPMVQKQYPKKHLLVNIDIDKPRIYIGPSRFMVYLNLAHDSKADVFGEGHISDILFQYF